LEDARIDVPERALIVTTGEKVVFAPPTRSVPLGVPVILQLPELHDADRPAGRPVALQLSIDPEPVKAEVRLWVVDEPTATEVSELALISTQ
jgi:hypothetical protein